MYDAIYNFAIKKQLEPIEYFTPKLISIYVLLDENSNYLGFEMKDKDNKEKTLCTDIGSLNFGAMNCNPITESVSYIFDKNQKKHNGFLSIMKLGAKQSKNVEIVYKFLQDFEDDSLLEEKILNDIKQLKIKSSFIASFKINNLRLEEDDSWKPWFINYMKEMQPEKEVEKTISLITGNEVIPLTDKSPMIKNPSNILGTGAYITSSACNAFQSYGLTDNRNSPIGKNEAIILKEGLEYLLSNPNHFNKDFGIIHFCEDERNDKILCEIFNPLKDLYQNKEIEDESVVKKNKDLILENTFNSAKTGNAINNEIENDVFHIMQFSLPTKGRFFLSNYKKGSCKELQQNIFQWREDSKIEWYYYDKSQELWKISNDFIQNIYSIFFHSLEEKNAENKLDQIKKEFGDNKINLLFSIIENKQIPFKVFQKSLFALRKAFMKDKKIDKVCLQTIKAYLVREQRKKGEVSIMDKLNPNESNVGYSCGRLFAVYEQIQLKAQKNVNASITDNFFISAQQTPATVFPRLAKLSNHHLRKLDEPAKIYWNKKLQEVTGMLSEFPKKLDIEEQGMFVLGYYHQKADLFKKKEKGEENNEE